MTLVSAHFLTDKITDTELCEVELVLVSVHFLTDKIWSSVLLITSMFWSVLIS